MARCRPSPRASSAFSWSWPPARAKPTPRSRSFTACGSQPGRPTSRPAKSASSFWPTATSLSTRPWSTTFGRSRAPWPSSAPMPRAWSGSMRPRASTLLSSWTWPSTNPPSWWTSLTRFTSRSTRPCLARKKSRTSTGSSRQTFSTLSWWTNATGAVPTKTPPGAKS